MKTRLPLADFKVLDLTAHRAGPTAVRQLADWGADVIKIEPPGGPATDATGSRRSGPDFQNLHRNKRSLTLNLKAPEGKAIFFELAKTADVVVENFRSSVKHKLGVDYESVKKVNPRIVYGSISGFGQDGPYENRPGVDQIAQGMGGLMYVHPNVPAKSVAEFATYARANHQQLTFASSTLSEFLAATQFMNASKTAMTRVSYKGGAQALPDLLAGRVQVYFTPLGLALPYAREGRLRLLATLLPQRTQAAPDVPTMSEAGMPGVAVPSWQAMFAPPATAPIVSETLFRQAQRVLADAELRAQFDSIVLQIEGSTPQQLGRVVARDIETWRDFIRDNEIPQD